MTNQRGKGGNAGSFSQYATRAARKAADDAAKKATKKTRELISKSKGKSDEKSLANHTLLKRNTSVTITGEEDSKVANEDASIEGVKTTVISSAGSTQSAKAKDQVQVDELSHPTLADGDKPSSPESNDGAAESKAEGEALNISSALTRADTSDKRLEGEDSLHLLVGGAEDKANSDPTDAMAAVAAAVEDHLEEGKSPSNQPGGLLGVTMASARDNLPEQASANNPHINQPSAALVTPSKMKSLEGIRQQTASVPAEGSGPGSTTINSAYSSKRSDGTQRTKHRRSNKKRKSGHQRPTKPICPSEIATDDQTSHVSALSSKGSVSISGTSIPSDKERKRQSTSLSATRSKAHSGRSKPP
jgi:hypothetical protein